MCDFVPAWRVSTIPDVGKRWTDVKNVEKVIKKNQASQLPRDHISDSLTLVISLILSMSVQRRTCQQ